MHTALPHSVWMEAALGPKAGIGLPQGQAVLPKAMPAAVVHPDASSWPHTVPFHK